MKRFFAFALILVLLVSAMGCAKTPVSLPENSSPSDKAGTTIGDEQKTNDNTTDKGSTGEDVTADSSDGTTTGAGITDGTEGAGTGTGATDGPASSSTTTSGRADNSSAAMTTTGNKVATQTTTTARTTTVATTARTTAAPQSGHAHTMKKTVKYPPSCAQDGYTQVEYPCCGAVEAKTDIVPALGHSMGQWSTTVKPTNTAFGEAKRVCTRCSHEETKRLDPLPLVANAEQKAILDLVNAERKKAGLHELSYYAAEQAAADQRTQDIKVDFSHYRPDGDPFYVLLEGLGTDYFGCGENVAKGFYDAAEVMKGWMDSEKHRANILDSDFDAIVVGVDNGYWTQLFIDLD